MQLESQLEALLFWKGEPITKKKASAALNCSEEELETALLRLETALQGRGIRLMRHNDDIELRTAPEASQFIEKLTKEELSRDLGKAGLETLAIILYKGPIKRSEIDYIRGVNSSFIVRNLLVRGLVDRITEKEGDKRGFLYAPTMNLLAHLGVSKLEELPEYEKVKHEIETFTTSPDESSAA